MIKLGVNIDHIATLRQARKGMEPDPVAAARVCEAAGADSIVIHLREDRRHIQDRDLELLRKTVRTHLNLEMSISDEIVRIACAIKPDQSTLVPERRLELTTEGGLDVAAHLANISKAVARLKEKKIEVSLFIDPEKRQIDAARIAGATIVELHTGRYAGSGKRAVSALKQLRDAAEYASKRGLIVAAGHGLDYQNVGGIIAIPQIEEVNIGYSIICRAVFVGLDPAVKEMKRKLKG